MTSWLIETASFPGVPPAELGFLATAGLTVHGGAGTLSVLRDHDDTALIRANLGGTIPAWKWAYRFGVPEVVCPTVTID